MPNWVFNKVKFSDRGKEILDKVIVANINKEELETEDVVFDFNKIVPRPKTLNITSGGHDIQAMQYALSKMSFSQFEKTISKLKKIEVSYYGNYFSKIYKNGKYTLKELENEAKEFKKQLKNNRKTPFENIDYKGLGINSFEDLGNTYINNILNYGADSWYDWSINNWGTKWNASNTYVINDNMVEFETAWSCPVNIFKELSKQFKGVEICVDFADEDIGSNCGEIIFLNGEIKEYFDMDGDSDFALDVWGYDKDEYYEE